MILLYGLPGSGKSMIANRLAERLGSKTVAIDDIWKEKYAQPNYSESESNAVFAVLLDVVVDAIQWGTVPLIVEGVFASRARINSLEEVVKASGCHLTRVLVNATFGTLVHRLSTRAHYPSEAKLKWLSDKFETKDMADLVISTEDCSLLDLNNTIDLLAQKFSS